MSCSPRPRALPAAVLVLLAACASLLGVGSTASAVSGARSTVAASHGQPSAAPGPARQGALREARDASARRLHRDKSASPAQVNAVDSAVTAIGSPGVAAVLVAMLLGGLLGRLATRPGPVTAPSGRTAGSHPGRGPPASLRA